MKKLKNCHPVVFCLLCTVISAILLYVLQGIYIFLIYKGIIPTALVSGKVLWYSMIIADLAVSIFVLLVMRACGIQHILNKKTAGIKKCLLVPLPVLLFDIFAFFAQLLIFSEGSPVPAIDRIIVFLLSNFLIGFSEEILFRGLIATTLLEFFGTGREGILKACFLSSLLFGLTHLTNYTGGNPSGVIMQVIATFGSGVLYCAIYFRTGSLWLLVFIHTLEDIYAGISELFSVGYSGSAEDAAALINSYSTMLLLPALGGLVLGLFLLRKSKMEEVKALWSR